VELGLLGGAGMRGPGSARRVAAATCTRCWLVLLCVVEERIANRSTETEALRWGFRQPRWCCVMICRVNPSFRRATAYAFFVGAGGCAAAQALLPPPHKSCTFASLVQTAIQPEGDKTGATPSSRLLGWALTPAREGCPKRMGNPSDLGET